MRSVPFTLFSVFLIATIPLQGRAVSDLKVTSSSPFSVALETLQKQLGYTFKSIDLLRRAMTHASFSEENNRALSILGANVINTAVSYKSLAKDIDISSKDLNRRISEISNAESSCAVDGLRLGLQKVVRVSAKTNSSASVVVFGAFRAIFGAIVVDDANCDTAGNIFRALHGGDGKKKTKIVIISAVVESGLICLGISIWLVRFKRKKVSAASCCKDTDVPVFDIANKSRHISAEFSGSAELSLEGNELSGPELPTYNFDSIAVATNNFSEENKLGKEDLVLSTRESFVGAKKSQSRGFQEDLDKV